MGLMLMMWLILLATVICIILKFLLSPRKLDLCNKHVMITGGSSGIGKALAHVCLEKGARVSLIARNLERLQDAESELIKAGNASEKIAIISADVSGSEDDLKKAVTHAEQALGPCAVLICSAGITHAKTFEDTTLQDFKRVIDINLFGTVSAVRVVLPGMLARGNGSIALVSSMAGQLGVYGYSAYSASKFALRGLAESLQMEVKHRGIDVCLVFPPDTDTPMFRGEKDDRPAACEEIAGAAGLWDASRVAEAIVADIQRRRFLTWFGVDGLMLTTVSAGMSPSHLTQAVFQVLTSGLFRLIGLFYVGHFYRIARRADERERKLR